MDEMKLKLKTNFMKGILSKIISKVISNKIGLKSEIKINEIDVEMINGEMHFHINADGKVDEKELIKINKLIDLD